MSPRAEVVRDDVKAALRQTLEALERAETDDDVRTIVEIVEGYGSAGYSVRLRPLGDVEDRMRASSARLARITRP